MSKHEAPLVSHEDNSFLRDHMDQEVTDTSLETELEDEEELPALPKRAKWQPDGTVLLTLRKSVVQTTEVPGGGHSEQTVSTLTFHPLTGAAMLRIQAVKGDGPRALMMMKESTKMGGFVGEAILKRLDARDYVAATVISSIFTNPGL